MGFYKNSRRKGFTGGFPVNGGEEFSTNASKLSGSGQYYNVGNDASLQITGDITVGGWMKFDNASATQFIAGKRKITDVSWSMHMFGGKVHWVCNDDDMASTDLGGATTLSNDTWYEIFGVLSGSTMEIFIDGVSDGTTAHTGGLFNSTADMRIGIYEGQSLALDGSMEFFKIYDAAKTAGNLLTSYNSGVALCYDQADQTDLVSFWDLGNWTGHTAQEETDQHGSSNATNVGSIAYTGTGLNVLC